MPGKSGAIQTTSSFLNTETKNTDFPLVDQGILFRTKDTIAAKGWRRCYCFSDLLASAVPRTRQHVGIPPKSKFTNFAFLSLDIA